MAAAECPLAHPRLIIAFTGVLSKRSELMGIWQQRRVEVDVGSLRYFRDGCAEPRACFGPGDVVGVGCQSPSMVLLRARLAGGDERTYELRAQDDGEMHTWAQVIGLAFGLEAEGALLGTADEQHRQPARRSERGAPGEAVGRVASAASGAAAAVAGLFGRATGKARPRAEGDEKLDNARQLSGRLREQLEQQMEEALTSCDDGKMEALLDAALSRGLPWEKLPGPVHRAARRVAGRNLRSAADSSDPKQLKGALLAARRLHATGVPEFEPAVARYREVQRLPAGWDVARMVEQRRSGARLLAKNDVSSDEALRSLIQFMVDRTFRRVETRDRRGEQMPVQLRVIQVAEVQNEMMASGWTTWSGGRPSARRSPRAPVRRACRASPASARRRRAPWSRLPPWGSCTTRTSPYQRA
ncbi:unnamed protein product [Prorocentrum cordatum]|uniref:Uncharacterized protein n=1 Tax=Prorocentrum cordatum TaxID=2364126 RepID=A0ABN9YM84_9DINO|nr:unnamed protein product [Polarella glacialis]